MKIPKETAVFLTPATGALPRDARERRGSGGPNVEATTSRGRARGAQKNNSNALRHGVYARAAGRIDRRRTVDRRVLETIAALEQALGDRLSPQRALILANVGRWLRDLAKLEAYEAELGTIVHRRRRDVLPVTEKRWKLLEQINRALERVGLDVERPTHPSLADVFRKYRDDDPDAA